jgi:drug/metabolite transporter (DMT)-like permease
MQRKSHLDAFGVTALLGFALLMAFNQIIIKFTNGGLQPVFFAGLRSAGAVVCIGAYIWARGIPFGVSGPTLRGGLLAGLFFTGEFFLLFTALDHTTVSRSVIMLYSMPIWMALGAHLLIPGERLTGRKALGLTVAMAGVVLAMSDRAATGQASLYGDLCALGAAICWASLALVAKATDLKLAKPEVQIFWQVLVSAVILLAIAAFFGPFIRDLVPLHLLGLAFQIIVVVSGAFVFWFWLLSVYPASGVASFSFVTPVFGVGLGWLLLGDPVGPRLIAALVLVAVGIVLINTTGAFTSRRMSA